MQPQTHTLDLPQFMVALLVFIVDFWTAFWLIFNVPLLSIGMYARVSFVFIKI